MLKSQNYFLVAVTAILNLVECNRIAEISNLNEVSFHRQSHGIKDFDQEVSYQEKFIQPLLSDHLAIARSAQDYVNTMINLRVTKRLLQGYNYGNLSGYGDFNGYGDLNNFDFSSLGNLGNLGGLDLSSLDDLSQYNITAEDLMNINTPADFEKLMSKVKEFARLRERNDFYSTYKNSFFTVNKCISYIGEQLSMVNTKSLSQKDVNINAIPKSLINQLKAFFKTFKIAYKAKFGEDIITSTDLDNDMEVITLFLQGGMNSVTDLEEADSKNASDDKKLWIIAAIIIPIVLLSVIIILICVFACCTKVKKVNGQDKRVCRKATKNGKCMKKFFKSDSNNKNKIHSHQQNHGKVHHNTNQVDDQKIHNGPNVYSQVQNTNSSVLYGNNGYQHQNFDNSHLSMGIPVVDTSVNNGYMVNNQYPNQQQMAPPQMMYDQHQQFQVGQVGYQNYPPQQQLYPPQMNVVPGSTWQ
ncbi:UNKNOWN [Stylonychia lemnae]|uniref:Uncharacterized protein n=1 Tax=Stylonychia lemnae TaxID=5949 RepID=A0A077ZU83_STYLE|nr:UNKNOWN [Stylonychia lemnae]|eukprot:CDW72021.1 UNKNOWN [Stylonychia lemnae]